MRAPISFATDSHRNVQRLVVLGTACVLILLAATAWFLFAALPDAGAFDARVERIFVENDALTSPSETRFLEILAQSGTAFSETLASYRLVIFVLLVFGAAMLLATLLFLLTLLSLNRRLAQVDRAGLHVNSLILSRDEGLVYLNDMAFKLTDAAMETLAVLAEARMDSDILTGAELEGVISGRASSDCEEAAGATRIKRLRDALGNQILSEVLIRNVARKGYVLAIDPQVIEVR